MGIKNFMNRINFFYFQYDWLIKRIPVIVSIFIDITIIYFVFSFFNNSRLLSDFYFWNNLLQTIIWCILSYVVGRYIRRKISLKALVFLKYFKKTFLVSCFIIIINLLSKNLLTFLKIDQIEIFEFPLKELIIISLISLITQFLKEL